MLNTLFVFVWPFYILIFSNDGKNVMKCIRILDELGIKKAFIKYGFLGFPSSAVITQLNNKRIEIYPTNEPGTSVGNRYIKGPQLYYIFARVKTDYPNFKEINEKEINIGVALTEDEKRIIFGKTKQIERLKSALKFLIESYPPEKFTGKDFVIDGDDVNKFFSGNLGKKIEHIGLKSDEELFGLWKEQDAMESIEERIETDGLNKDEIKKEFNDIDVKRFYDSKRNLKKWRFIFLIVGFIIAILILNFILPPEPD